jgi:hypothetical protein
MAKVGRKMGRGERSLRWARDGAIIALLLSALSLLLPEPWGGLGIWHDPYLAVHHAAAIVTRVVVFALAGAVLGSLWGRRHGRRL